MTQPTIGGDASQESRVMHRMFHGQEPAEGHTVNYNGESNQDDTEDLRRF